MAYIETTHGQTVYRITSDDQSTCMRFIPAKGGMAYSLTMNIAGKARELLYCHDNLWDTHYDDLLGGWPFLFPICARIARNGEFGVYLYDGQHYKLPIHGFAPYLPWQVKSHTDHSLCLSLEDNEQTQAMFPFAFRIELDYVVKANQVICLQRYYNRDDKPMPYYAGFHPYLNTTAFSDNKQDVMLQYQPIRRLRYNADLTDIIGEQAVFALPKSVSDPAINEQLTLVGENKLVQLSGPEAWKLNLEVQGLEDEFLFPYVQLYTMADKPFFCIEPWMSFPNAMNSMKGVRWLAPGSMEEGILNLWLTES